MAFPPLQLRAGSLLEAEATGAPDNGLNQILLPFVAAGIDPSQVIGEDDGNRLDVRLLNAGPGITAVSNAVPNVSADGSFLNLNFVTDGVSQATLVVILRHTSIR